MANSPQIEFLPEPGMDVRQLFILLHGVGGTPDSLLPLAEAVRAAFPTAAVLIPEGFEPFDRRQWFSVRGVTEENRPRGRRRCRRWPPMCSRRSNASACCNRPWPASRRAPSWRWSWCRRMTAWPAA